MRSVLLTSTALLALLPVAAIGQTAPTSAPADTSTTGLGDIIVTAQRSSENSQRAAVPLAVVQGDTLRNAGVTQVDRLNALAPSLSIEPSSTGALIFVRGVGNFTVVPNSDPAVAFNYDGVYVGRPTSLTGVFYDLDRVEVLKGPQGILYGRNATGGAINVLPMQPKLGQLSGYASATYGSYNTINAEGAINVPFGDKGAMRLSLTTSNHDAYLKDGTSDQRTIAGRLQIKAELTPSLTVRVAGDYAHDGGVGNGVSYYGRYAYNPRVPISTTPVPGTDYYNFIPSGLNVNEGVYSAASQAYRQATPFGPLGRNLDALSPYAFQRNDFFGANAEIDWRTGAGTLTVIPAWRYSHLNYLADAAAFIYRDQETDEQYSLEARFSGNRISIFDYQVGLYYYREMIHSTPQLSISNTANFIDEKFDTKSYAAFGRLTAHLSDRLRLVGGLRYTQDDKGFDYYALGAVVNCIARNAFGAPACPTAPLLPAFRDPSTLTFPFPAAGGAPIPVFTGPGGPNYLIIRTDTSFVRSLSNHRLTYRGAAEFDVGPRSLLYASIESGYRSGGFSAAVGFETFQPEYLTAYTIGMKNRFFGNRVQLNIEGFIWNYKNQQVNHVGLDLNGRNANYTQNVGASRIKGVEVDGRVLATPTTLLSADVQYLDAKALNYTFAAGPGNPPLTGCPVSYNAASASPYTINCSGFQSYNSPKWTINLEAQQTINVGAYKFVAGVDTQYKGKRNIGFQYLPEQTLPGDWTTNAQIMVGPRDDRWSIAAYVHNIEDNRTPIFSSTHPTANFLISGTTAPRTYGARVGFKF